MGRCRRRFSTWPITAASVSWPIDWASTASTGKAATVVLKFRPQANLDPMRLVAVVRARPDLTLIPPAALKLSLDAAGGASTGCRWVVGGRAARASGQGPIRGRVVARSSAAPSWWTTRAREGAVKPGFSKEEILRPAKDDPRAAGGVFERVGDVLSELLDRG